LFQECRHVVSPPRFRPGLLSAAFAALSGVALSAGLAVAQEKGAAFDFRDPLTLESYDSAEQRGDYRPRFERELGNANETRNTGALDRSPGAQTGDVNSLSEEMEGRGGLVPFFKNTFGDR